MPDLTPTIAFYGLTLYSLLATILIFVLNYHRQQNSISSDHFRNETSALRTVCARLEELNEKLTLNNLDLSRRHEVITRLLRYDPNRRLLFIHFSNHLNLSDFYVRTLNTLKVNASNENLP